MELSEALDWIGTRVDDVYGGRLGKLVDVYVEEGTTEPAWLVVQLGRFGGERVCVPTVDVMYGGGRLWVPFEREAVKNSPPLPEDAPLTAIQDTVLREHYGMDPAGGATSAVEARSALTL
jgi:hypothetical protein